ncbi:discoidin domain-containing protein [Plantactinospora solaniradicis]|uniref:Discoidin domain-containing protein n=1 Tax=Plantactinospora solaniradicis TaxID=1723736 RepID=A0ABW1KCV5_9ACTN
MRSILRRRLAGLAGLSPRRRAVSAAVAAGAAVALAGTTMAVSGAGPADATKPGGSTWLSLGSDVTQVAVNPVPCANQGFELRFGNVGASEVYADAFLEAPAPLVLSRYLVSSYLPAGYTLKVKITVTAPRATPPGRYEVTVRAGKERLSVPVEVVAPPVDETGNLARYVPVSASSENLPTYPACGAVDGDRDSNHWASTTGWNDSTRGTFPDWLQVTFDRPQTVGRVDLYTLDSARYPATGYGLRDWDVQVSSGGGAWQTVGQVRGNLVGMVSTTFPPVSADAVRIVTLASNEGVTYSRVVELEIYAS